MKKPDATRAVLKDIRGEITALRGEVRLELDEMRTPVDELRAEVASQNQRIVESEIARRRR